MNLSGMRLLTVSNFFYSSFGWSISRAFRLLDADVTEFESVARSLQRYPCIRTIRVKQINRALSKEVRTLRPDLVVITKGDLIERQTVEELAAHSRVVLWFQDTMIADYHRICQALPFYHHVFVKDPYLVDSLKKAGLSNTHLLPHCCDTELHARHEISAREQSLFGSDINIVGSFYPWRQLILTPLAEKGLKIWGGGWDGLPADSPLIPSVMGRDARNLDQAKVFQSSTVSVNTHTIGDVLGANQRVFDIAGSGGAQVCDFKEDIPRYLRPDEEILLFKTRDELIEKVEYLLRHPAEAKSLGEAAFKACRERRHSYEDRMREMYDIVSSRCA